MSLRAYDRVTGTELVDLLAPVTPARFIEEFWAKKPLFVKGPRDKFADLFGRRALERAVRTPSAAGAPPNIKASFDRVVIPDEFSPALYLKPDQVNDAFAADATICVSAVHEHDANLARLAAAIKAQLGYTGDVGVHCYMSPDGCGFDTHFDSRVASTLQLEGSKRWRFGRRPAVDWPVSNARYVSGGDARWHQPEAGLDAWEQPHRQKESEFDEVVLEPGDLLILPAGTWHNASAKGYSLAVNLYFQPAPATSLLAALLTPRFQADPAWRCLPPLLDEGGVLRDEARLTLASVLSDASSALARAADDPELLAACAQLVAAGRARVLMPPWAGATPPADPRAGLAPGDELCLPTDAVVFRFAEAGRASWSLYIGDNRLEVDEGSRTFFTRLLERRRFVAEEASAWTESGQPRPWAATEALLTSLLDVGALERAPRGA